MNVYILATCRKEELLPYTLLIFKSIRVGFPTANIQVAGNALPEFALGQVIEACAASGCSFLNGSETIHHHFIEDLLTTEYEPFILCDTDIHFFNNVEDWKFDTALAGFRIPEFFDEFTNAITRSRLHTSLLYIDPVKVREQVKAYESQFPSTPFNPLVNLIHPLCLPFNGRGYFHDTCSLVYHAIGGTAFTDQQKDCYYHANFGCLEDIVLPRLTTTDYFKAMRDSILANPELGRGVWRMQEQHYESRQPFMDGSNVITPVKPEEAAKAREWNFEVCKGNEEAMSFGDLWYGYVHGIDDLVDTMRDGRPTMSREQMISLFFCACLLYNHPYYLRNQRMLYPIILETTNLYKMSVGWERSPNPQLRIIGDVLRSCGLKMHTMIALLCGGEAHMIDIARRMYEQDYRFQHDANGSPI